MPAVTVVPEGVAVSEKSAKKIEIVTVPVCPPPVPVTVRFKGLAVLAVRPDTVSVLDPPTEIEVGLKVHVAPLLQDKAIGDRKLLGPVAAIAKVVAVEPMRITLDRALLESEKTGLPVPVSCSAGELTAFEVTRTLPVTLPVEVGVKLTEIVQVWPTLNDAGTVGKLVPQSLVSPNPVVAVMSVMVTG